MALLMVALGAGASLVNFMVGRRFANMTREGALAMEQQNENGGKAVDLDGMRRLGRIMMLSSPVPLLALGYVGLSGMAG